MRVNAQPAGRFHFSEIHCYLELKFFLSGFGVFASIMAGAGALVLNIFSQGSLFQLNATSSS